MKKIIQAFIVSLLSILVLTPSYVLAQERTMVVGEDQVINQNPYFIAGDQVEINGTVNGDVYTAGGVVTINGTVNGDLLVAGGQIRINGRVTEDVRAIGGDLTHNGRVDGNISMAGGNIRLERDSFTQGALTAAGGNLVLAGPIEDNVSIAGGNLEINNTIAGNLDMAGGEIVLGPDASVEGDLNYWSENDINLNSDAAVSGEITKHTPPVKIDRQAPTPQERTQASLIGRIINAITLFLIGFLLLRFFPNFMERAADNLEKNPWRSLGIGFIVLFLAPFAFLMLLVTLVGIPLAFILLGVYLIISYLAKFFVIYWVGRKIAPEKSPLIMLLAGILIYEIIALLPPISWIVWFFVLMFGLGVLIISLQDSFQTARKAKIA